MVSSPQDTKPWSIDQLWALNNRNSTSDIDCQKADDGKTEQAHLKDSDINNIVARFLKTGALDEWNIRTQTPVYGDFTQAQDFQTNLNTVIAAQDAFAALPADIRKRFGNDPVQLMEFLGDSKNEAEAIALGLVNPKPAAVVPAAPSSPPPTPTK